jgi:hypothetical protein
MQEINGFPLQCDQYMRGPFPGCPIVLPDNGFELATKMTLGLSGIEPWRICPLRYDCCVPASTLPVSSYRDVDSTTVFVTCMSICVLWIVVTSCSQGFEFAYR